MLYSVFSARGSGRKRKAWGGAQRNPRKTFVKRIAARGAGDSPELTKAAARYRGLKSYLER